MNKEFNIIEAVNMPEGTEFEMFSKSGIKKTQKVIVLEKSGSHKLIWEDGRDVKAYDDTINARFIPVPKLVSFMEAVGSGHRIKVEHNLIDDAILNKKDIYFRSDSPHNRKALEMFRRKEFMSPNLLFSALGYLFDGSEIAEIVNNGKWYIEG